MALKEGSETRVGNFLADQYPDWVTAYEISRELDEDVQKVELILQRKLIRQSFCEKIAADDGQSHQFRATDLLVAYFHPEGEPPAGEEEAQSRDSSEDATDTYADDPQSRGPVELAPETKKGSILPMRMARNPIGNPQQMPYYMSPSMAYPYAPGPGMMFTYPPPHPVYYNPHHMTPAAQDPVHYRMPFQQQSVQRPSILPMVPKPKIRPDTRPSSSSESHQMLVESVDTGRFDSSYFPDGLWDHLLFETRDVRAKTAEVEKLMGRNFAPGIQNEKGQTGMFGSSKAGPGGRGLQALSMDAVQSLSSMGPPPPGFGPPPVESPPPEEISDPSVCSLNPFGLEKSGRGPSEDVVDSSASFMSASD